MMICLFLIGDHFGSWTFYFYKKFMFKVKWNQPVAMQVSMIILYIPVNDLFGSWIFHYE